MGKIKGDTTSVINGSNYIAQCGKKFSMKFHKMRQSTWNGPIRLLEIVEVINLIK